jgi:hypothetical protein
VGRGSAESILPTRFRGTVIVVGLSPLLCLALFSGCRRAKNPGSQASTNVRSQVVPAATQHTPGPVEAQFRNLEFHVDSGVVLHIRWLRGELARTHDDVPPTFDDPRSFVFRTKAAVVSLPPDGLARLMNEYVFNYADAPLRNLKITIAGDRLKQEGTLKKGVGIPFELEGVLSATPDGMVRLHSSKIKSAHLPVKGLMDLLGVKLASVVNVNQSRGVRVEGDDLFLNPAAMLPPPRIEGKVSAARIENGQVVLEFGNDEDDHPLSLPDPGARNYMYFRGGTLRFGKLTMADSDLEIVDMDPSDPFDFDLSQYSRQLVAGYSKTTSTGALITFMPDLHRLGRRSPIEN